MNTANNQMPITLQICALGGEGGGVLCEWLVDVARHAGYAAQGTSIPGVAQRTGATTYYLEIFPIPLRELKGRRPVFSLNPVPGKLDVLISSELLETARQVANGISHASRTRIISATNRAYTTAERMVLGDGRVDDDTLINVLRQHSAQLNLLDMQGMAKEASTIVSAVMLGALAASGALPFARADYEAVIAPNSGASARQSWQGFEKAYAALQTQSQQHDLLNAMLNDEPSPQSLTAPTNLPKSLDVSVFPLAAQPLIALGAARVLDYQNVDYAKLYLSRLMRIAQSDSSDNAALTHHTARWLALWMAFDDVVRVADLKSRHSRYQRVQAEVKAKADDMLKIYDHFKPGVPEFAGLLPPALARRLLRWDSKRQARGQAAWALPLKIGTHSVGGMLALRCLAACKALRPIGSRYIEEQQLIETWLSGIENVTLHDSALALEFAQAGQLIKGYGSTNLRGKENLLHILQHAKTAEAAQSARLAALQDAAGKALDQVLVQHGAPARAIKPQPIRWVKNLLSEKFPPLTHARRCDEPQIYFECKPARRVDIQPR